MSRNLKLQNSKVKKFLDGLSRISDQSILTVEDDKIYSICSTQDNSMYLWSVLEGDFDTSAVLNLPSLKKLVKALNMIESEDIELKINTNNLEYKGKEAKFKIHLLEDGILNKAKLSLEKIKSFHYDVEFEVDKKFFANLLKKSAVFNTTKKLYLYTEDDHLVWSLGDKTLDNSDSLSIVGENVDFELDSFILNLENLRVVSFGSENSLKFRLNTDIGIGNFQLDSDGMTFNYIVTSLTK